MGFRAPWESEDGSKRACLRFDVGLLVGLRLCGAYLLVVACCLLPRVCPCSGSSRAGEVYCRAASLTTSRCSSVGVCNCN